MEKLSTENVVLGFFLLQCPARRIRPRSPWLYGRSERRYHFPTAGVANTVGGEPFGGVGAIRESPLRDRLVQTPAFRLLKASG